MAMTMGVDPMHFGIIFIVNLEIGYLTPPVGLNLFVASALFKRPVGHIFRSVAPFIGVMFIGLMLITYVPDISVGLGRAIMGVEAPTAVVAPQSTGGELGADDDGEEAPDDDEVSLEELARERERIRGLDMPSMEDMQREAVVMAEIDARLAALRAELERIQNLDAPSMEDMQREAEIDALLESFGGEDPPLE
jgi:C4-dicarboxylate transporter DctM subunit